MVGSERKYGFRKDVWKKGSTVFRWIKSNNKNLTLIETIKKDRIESKRHKIFEIRVEGKWVNKRDCTTNRSSTYLK